jgi:hypothetical protein
VVVVETRQGMYHEQRGLARPHLIVALNSGIHTYESWLPTLTCVLRSPLNLPFVVTAWNFTEMLVVRQILIDHTATPLADVRENPFGSLLPKEVVDAHGEASYDNRYMIVVRGKPVKKTAMV